MADQSGTRDHQYTMTELDDDVALDQIGSADMSSITAGVERTGNSFIFDGVAEEAQWNTGASHPLGDNSTDDWTQYVAFKLPSPTDVGPRITGALGNAKFPFIIWNLSSGTAVNFGVNNTGAARTLNTTSVTADTIIVAIMSSNLGTGVVNLAIHTSDGETGDRTDGRSVAVEADEPLTLANHSGTHGNVEIIEFGSWNSDLLLTDCVDTVEAILADVQARLNGDDENILPNIIPRIIPRMLPKLI